jgi:protein phosphatase 1L
VTSIVSTNFLLLDLISGMPSKHEIIWVEKYAVSSLCVAAVNAYQGRQPYMEDRFSVITNINGSEVSLYAIFDGHAGEFAADYAYNIIMPCIAEKISELIGLVRVKTAKPATKPVVEQKPVEDESEEAELTEPEVNPLEVYISPDNLINYEKLLHDEILASDKALLDRMARATLFGGTTANIVLVDLTNKLIVCANVGDSRAVMCDSKGKAFALSHDHKPNNPEEMTRIRDNGGYISNKSGCWRVEGTLACSRSLGDFPLKQKKVIIADPEITTFKFKDFK